jgi:TIR domain-containing protein
VQIPLCYHDRAGRTVVAEYRTFKAFFSYAREDAKADRRLIEALGRELEQRVNVQFVNDRFEIWRDTERLRLGDKWSPKIEAELRSADILIVLLTPRWLGSKSSARSRSRPAAATALPICTPSRRPRLICCWRSCRDSGDSDRRVCGPLCP